VSLFKVVCLRTGPANTDGKDDNSRSLIDSSRPTLMLYRRFDSLIPVDQFQKDREIHYLFTICSVAG
jgi:hypothetical protein